MPLRVFILGLIISTVPSLLFAQEPLEALQQGIDKAISVLDDPRFEEISRKQEQQQLLWQIMLQVFDFKEFSRRVLASHWYKFSPRQRNEFVALFSEFLGKFYLEKLQDRYGGQRVNFLRQQMVSNSKALVDIEVNWKKLTIPLTLRMTNRSGKWKVYDLSALGINAVSNYRAQFKAILSKESPKQIIGRLKDKIAALDEKS